MSCCSFIPDYVLEDEANATTDPAVRAALRRTIGVSDLLRASRAASAPQGSDRQAAHGNQVLLAHAPAGLHRTVYHAHNVESYEALPKDQILIKEGGALLTTAQDPTGDANEAYEGFKVVYDFYKTVYDRNSLNDKGLKLVAFVHFAQEFDNAFFNQHEIVFGNGGPLFKELSGFIDVVAHELTHGLIQWTGNLRYEGQSGALNESLADVFGIQIKQWKLKETDPTQTDPSTANWLIGEGIWRNGGKALRDMKNPGNAYRGDRQPAHFDDLYQGDSDNKGVHINSGIPNKAFHHACVKIGKPSWEGAGPIWYKALNDSQLQYDATFQEFANITLCHAGDYVAEVKAAWEAVGITPVHTHQPATSAN